MMGGDLKQLKESLNRFMSNDIITDKGYYLREVNNKIAFCWIDSEETRNIMMGLNPDGTERYDNIRAEELKRQMEREIESEPLDFDESIDSWEDCDDNDAIVKKYEVLLAECSLKPLVEPPYIIYNNLAQIAAYRSITGDEEGEPKSYYKFSPLEVSLPHPKFSRDCITSTCLSMSESQKRSLHKFSSRFSSGQGYPIISFNSEDRTVKLRFPKGSYESLFAMSFLFDKNICGNKYRFKSDIKNQRSNNRNGKRKNGRHRLGSSNPNIKRGRKVYRQRKSK